jgi:hypothetical protein
MTVNNFIFFCCILVAGAVFLAGCTHNQDRFQPAATPVISSDTAGQPAGASVNLSCSTLVAADPRESPDYASNFITTELLTRPTDISVTVSLVPKKDLFIFFEYGTTPGSYPCQTPELRAKAGSPVNVTLTGLVPDEQYYYRTCYRETRTAGFNSGLEHSFHTDRSPGSTFAFGVQADSHPERANTMFNPALYKQTLHNADQVRPDFYISLGDDFSIDPLIEKGQLSQGTVDAVYLYQRNYFDIIGDSSPVFLVNGNHEEAARYLLDGTPDNAAVYAGISRMKFFPQPVPGEFYSGDTGPVQYVGLPGDYYAWTWGDALFVVIDPYWHSPVAVDNVVGKGGAKTRDPWGITLGETQYQWFKKTLSESDARYKFVFAHHVQGTGRGGIENAGLYEWGGDNQKGTSEFNTRRPGWELPIQQVMAENSVTIFFQGHDHLFARQGLDGVTYQEVPCPADPTYSTFNAEAYISGEKQPNSGYLRVTVSPQNTTVDYVKSYLPGKENLPDKNGMVAYSYTISGNNS